MRTRTILTLVLAAAATATSAHADERESGLLLRIYEIDTGVHFLPELAPNQLPNAVKVIPTLELRTDRGDFKPFEDQFVSEVTGYLNVEQAGLHAFRLISDDGSRLWIDERLVVDHDGLHGAEPKDGRVELAAGEHTLRVLHFESGGGEHLELQWRPPSAPEGKFELIPAELLTHAADASRETAPGAKRIIPPLRRGRPGDGTPVEDIHPSLEEGVFGRPPPVLPSQDDRLLVLTKPLIPMVWLAPALDAGACTTLTPSGLPSYSGQSLVGTGDTGELWRISVDEIGDSRQGCAFRFCSNLEHGFNALHVGIDRPIVSMVRERQHAGGLSVSYDLHLVSTGVLAFEMLAVRAMTNGFEIEFTKPLDPRCGWEPESYYIEQWAFSVGSDEVTKRRSDKGTEPGASATGHTQSEDSAPVRTDTGGQAARGTRKGTAQGAVAHQSEPEAQATAHPPRRDGIRYPVKSASVSPDRKKVFLEIENLKPSHVVYTRLLPPCISEDGELPWSTEAWYTLNVIPKDRYGKVLTPPPPEPQNFLTEEEKAAGWKLLFDGRTTNGWHGYRKDYFPDGWAVKDGCLVRVGPAGDIATDGEFGNFELKFEWRVCAAGNSGLFYRVNEKYDWPFFSGPEFQVLDNAEHADGRNPKTSAGSNYALHAPARDVTEPVGFFNQARIVADGPHIEHWLNGVKIVEYELWTDEWKQMVADSKFKAWPNYGLVKKGRIVLQDHGDMVWYRNIKIRELPAR